MPGKYQAARNQEENSVEYFHIGKLKNMYRQIFKPGLKLSFQTVLPGKFLRGGLNNMQGHEGFIQH